MEAVRGDDVDWNQLAEREHHHVQARAAEFPAEASSRVAWTWSKALLGPDQGHGKGMIDNRRPG